MYNQTLFICNHETCLPKKKLREKILYLCPPYKKRYIIGKCISRDQHRESKKGYLDIFGALCQSFSTEFLANNFMEH